MDINISNIYISIHNATCQILMDGCNLLTLTRHYGYSCNEVA